MPFQGEASQQPTKIVAAYNSGTVHSITKQKVLQLAQETVIRTLEVSDGESIIYVTSRLR
jgi:hypothetical protein